MSSPNMNNILLMGCILCYSSVFIKPLEVSSGAVCKVNVSSCMAYMSHVIVIVISSLSYYCFIKCTIFSFITFVLYLCNVWML